MNGGPRLGSGRRSPDNRGWIRSQPVKAMFRPPEYEDLQTIAEAWGVPVGTAMWAIVAGELSRWRREAPEFGPHGLAIAAAVTVLRMKGAGDPVGSDDAAPAERL